MLKFILVLLGLVFGQNNANNSGNNDNKLSTNQLVDPGDGLDPDGNGGPGNGNGGSTGGNTGQTPPPFTQL
jgi:hypothetical protein